MPPALFNIALETLASSTILMRIAPAAFALSIAVIKIKPVHVGELVLSLDVAERIVLDEFGVEFVQDAAQ